ncbi:hypothetical protein [Dyadobacter sp. CY312]|uniref:hypothetical protein n=1 Tax=Dyadobacter sp. CY312 TaxID=2907303 RepID=UPI001F422CEE|nr:hypothetical protein [Dyadobacter sp. CY312]MCE7040307.1 hypothetical protein [Dyadobacter sp. CY312]
MAKKQSGQFDKIFKENLEAVIPTLIAKLLKIQPVISEELQDNIQHTRERRPDVLRKITDVNNNTFVLHLEIQLSNEPEMVFRMAEYDLMLLRKYRLPVEQYVIYIGKGKPAMPLKLQTKRHQFQFPMIVMADIDYQIFLESTNPGEVVFAILGDFKSENPKDAVTNIVKRVHETSHSDFTLKRHLVQLRVLSQIRKLELLTQKAMESISKYFKEEKDFLYVKGHERGLSQKEYEKNVSFTKSLIQETAFDDIKIASLVGVTVDFVVQIRESIEK